MIPSILVIKQDPAPLIRELGQELQNTARIFPAMTGIDGIRAFQKLAPMAVVIDEDLPDMHGVSVASVLKDTEEGKDAIVYVINVSNLLQNSKADSFMTKPVNMEIFIAQVRRDIEKKLLLNSKSDEIQKAMSIQRGQLPTPFSKPKFDISYLFSPYNDLSGDGLYYWYPESSKSKDRLYGFLFDCTGHDISSYGQCTSLWFSLRRGLQDFQREIVPSLGEVMDNINHDLMEFSFATDEPNMPVAISFYFDFKDGILHYCPAGNPEILVKRKDANEYESIKMKSSPFGYLPDIQYKEQTLAISDIREVIFSSDGFSELLLKNQFPDLPMERAKHDDVSAIFVKLKL